MKLDTKKIHQFQKKVYRYYEEHKRDLPWRRTRNPYRVFVSEVMLQQTQVDRVVEYYKNFLKRFPMVQDLAKAPLRDVLMLWQGLGYNRRGKYLHEAAKAIVKDRDGKFPKTVEELQSLPGIGPYTAAAITVFAYNQPVVVIETNIRAVIIYEFFPKRKKVRDSDVLELIDQTMDRENPREWYNAIMDYGAMIKREHANPSRKSAHHTVQSKFKGSEREVRGAILRSLASKNKLTLAALIKETGFEKERVERNAEKLVAEGMIEKQNRSYVIPA